MYKRTSTVIIKTIREKKKEIILRNYGLLKFPNAVHKNAFTLCTITITSLYIIEGRPISVNINVVLQTMPYLYIKKFPLGYRLFLRSLRCSSLIISMQFKLIILNLSTTGLFLLENT